MNRVLLILYVVLCLEAGILLFVFPWLSLWDRNFFAGQYPWVSALAKNYFVRGAISGIGLADIALAVCEFWRFRRELGLGRVRSSG